MFRETLKNINKEQLWSEQNNFEAAFDKSHMTQRLKMVTHETGRLTNFVGLVNAMTPRVGSKEVDSVTSDSSDSGEDCSRQGGEQTVADLLECFQAISLNGLKIGLDDDKGNMRKAEFMASLSGLNLVKKPARNAEQIPDIEIDISQHATPLKHQTPNPRESSCTNQKTTASSAHIGSFPSFKNTTGTKQDLDFEEEHSQKLSFSESEQPFNRRPLSVKVKELLRQPKVNKSKGQFKLRDLDLENSWFAILYQFHRLTRLNCEEDEAGRPKVQSFLAYYKINQRHEIEISGLIQESSALLTGDNSRQAFWHQSSHASNPLDAINSKNLEFKLAYQLKTAIEDLGRDETYLLETHGDFMRIWNRKKIEHQKNDLFF